MPRRPNRTSWIADDRFATLALLDSDLELYLVMDPLTDEATATQARCGNAVLLKCSLNNLHCAGGRMSVEALYGEEDAAGYADPIMVSIMAFHKWMACLMDV